MVIFRLTVGFIKKPRCDGDSCGMLSMPFTYCIALISFGGDGLWVMMVCDTL